MCCKKEFYVLKPGSVRKQHIATCREVGAVKSKKWPNSCVIPNQSQSATTGKYTYMVTICDNTS